MQRAHGSRVSSQCSPWCARKGRCLLQCSELGLRQQVGIVPQPQRPTVSGKTDPQTTTHETGLLGALRILSRAYIPPLPVNVFGYFRNCSFPWGALFTSVFFSYRTTQWCELFHLEKEEKVFSQFQCPVVWVLTAHNGMAEAAPRKGCAPREVSEGQDSLGLLCLCIGGAWRERRGRG